MRFLIPAATCCALLLCALFAGCTSPTEAGIQPVGTTVTTPVETTQTATPAPTFEPITTLPGKPSDRFHGQQGPPHGQDHPPVDHWGPA